VSTRLVVNPIAERIMPTCRIIPFIPKEEEIDALIAGSGKKLTTYLQLLKKQE